MVRKAHNKRHLIAGSLLALFVAYYANITLFYHCHVINGVTIVHSHFPMGEKGTTPHSTNELALISFSSHFHSLAAQSFQPDLHIIFVAGGTVPERHYSFQGTEFVFCCLLRAPPVNVQIA